MLRYVRTSIGPLVACLLAVAALGGGAAGASAASSTFTTGFTDSVFLSAHPDPWFTRTREAGAQLVLLPVFWARIAPEPPAGGSAPSDPANPAYDWSSLDRAVRAASAQGLSVALDVASERGPAWADGPGRPASALPGTWRPSAVAYGAFAHAVAARYSGSFDPGDGLLPRVRIYEAWNEPNLNTYLAPQWTGPKAHPQPASPAIYRGLLNALYNGVKSVNAANIVVAGATAPFGDPPGGRRMPPAEFVRELLCLRGKALKSEHCPEPARFDIFAHHPYEVGGPFSRAAYHDDVTLPDMARLTTPLRVAEQRGLVLPRGSKGVWITEFSWDSNPPDPAGVPVMTRARWIDEAFWELWREGVSAITWYLVADQPPVPSYAATYQSGMFFSNGRPKPGLEAFRFPFLVQPAGASRWLVWGVAPQAGIVRVEVRRGASWHALFNVAAGAHSVFTRQISAPRREILRATLDGESSLAWPAG